MAEPQEASSYSINASRSSTGLEPSTSQNQIEMSPFIPQSDNAV